jgi:hypothetical protein
LLAIALVALLTASLSGTTGYTSASVDRPVSVAVVPDDRAFVDVELVPDDDGLAVTLTNRFRMTVRATASTTVDRRTASITAGGVEQVRLDCSSGESASVAIHVVSAADDSVEVSLTRAVRCPDDADGDNEDDRSDGTEEDDGDDGDDETDEDEKDDPKT